MPGSIGGAGTPSQTNAPRPPDKGAFPLDHFAECRKYMKAYMDCMKQNNQTHAKCRVETVAFLKCRVDRDLMAPEDLNNFGLGEKVDTVAADQATAEWERQKKAKLQQGFVAGFHRKARTPDEVPRA